MLARQVFQRRQLHRLPDGHAGPKLRSSFVLVFCSDFAHPLLSSFASLFSSIQYFAHDVLALVYCAYQHLTPGGG
jgi:hypothetical protein